MIDHKDQEPRDDASGPDIRCVKLAPYKVDDRPFLDVQQVIPAPRREKTVRVRRRERQARAAVQKRIDSSSGDGPAS